MNSERSSYSSALAPDGRFLILVCFVPSLGGFLFGFDTAVISGTVDMVERLFDLSKLQVGWFTSSALVGCILGALVAGALGDKYGRKPIMLVSAALFFLSAFGSMVPPSFTLLIPARMIGGIGVGMASVLAPMYISELAPPRLRGRLVALYQLSIVLGILLAYFSNWLLQNHAGDGLTTQQHSTFYSWIFKEQVWRAMFGMEMVPAALFFLLLLLVPESPRWLLKANEGKKAFSILCRINGKDIAHKETEEIETALEREEDSFRELFKPGLRTALMVGIGLSVFGQLTGINVIIYYGPTILRDAGIAFDSALQYQVSIGLINLIFTIIALLVIDRLGRRPLLIGGMSAVVVMLTIAGILFSMENPPGMLIVIVLAADVACLALSICAVIWVLTPEIYPNRIRGRAMSIATLSNWGTNTLSAYLFPWYVGTFGMHSGFFTFAGICFVAVLFFYRFVPETKGKSLEEIERIWIDT
jgi:SP family arabinose:H+ symporter-like MFS transporter